MLQLRTNETLDGGDHGWLKARHHFAVSTNGNPANGPLGALVVWNDDEIAPGTGFGRHPHADMEIITYVRQGVVTHEDSAGNIGRTVAGDVQVIGVPDHKYGEEVCAWIRLHDGVTATEQEFRDFCRGQIATFKIPRYIRFTREFPMTVTGKVQKFRMREITVAELTTALANDVEST